MTSVSTRSGGARRARASAASPSATASTSQRSREQPRDVIAHVGVVVGEQDARRAAPALRRRAAAARPRRRTRARRPESSAAPPRRTAPRRRRSSRSAARRRDAVRGRCAAPQRQRDREGRARPAALSTRHGAAVQLDQLLHEREADAGALVRARPRALHAVEALEERAAARSAGMPMPVSRTASTACVVATVQRDRDLAVEGELERVREEVEDDLLPHLAVDVRPARRAARASSVERRPARSTAERNTLASSRVSAARSVGS